MQDLSSKISDMVQDAIGDRDDLFVVDVIVKGNAGNQKVVVLVDGDEGIGIDDCSDISRKLSEQLDAENVLEDKYTLEVSSPGVDYPLKFQRQYNKNIGRRVKVRLNDGKILKGELLRVDNTEITISAEKKLNKKVVKEELNIPLETINRTNVLVTF